MAVRLGSMVFHAWQSIPVPGGYTDTFQLCIRPDTGLPPRDYAQVIRRMVKPVFPLRKSMSLWVEIEGANGYWYRRELRNSLRGLPCPIAVLNGERVPDDRDFSFRPWTGTQPSPPPPAAEPLYDPHILSSIQWLCLQVLARLHAAYTAEIGSLAGLDNVETRLALGELVKQGYVAYRQPREPDSKNVLEGKTGKKELEPQGTTGRNPEDTYVYGRYPFWEIRRPGVSMTLRSWGISPGVSFRERKEAAYVSNWHRRIARMWPGWLRQVWPHLEVWGTWTEIPLGSLRPDVLVWGSLWGKEALVVLELERGNRTQDLLGPRIWDRFNRALRYGRGFKLPIVFVLLSPPWVRKTALKFFGNIPQDAAVVLADWRRPDVRKKNFPIPEWGTTRFVLE